MKGTKLWQAPGSPIIQGRSRTQRPFWEVWAAGASGAEVVVIALAVAWTLRTPGPTFVDAVAAVFAGMLIPSLPGSILGAALGTLLARVMGSRHPWRVGLVGGALAGCVTALVL